MTDVFFPRLSDKTADAEGVVATWLVADGDHVATGQLIGEVMMDKVAAEVVAPTTGEIRLLVPEGETVRQGATIARVDG